DSFDRSSFMSGVKVALEKAADLNQLYVGLENIL
ncbi:4-hydroxy-tetrahydrodipicolinate reductase, partial [Lactobacillus delbrueckii subsp. lactis]|nr:4-hydroxy-tetrahydrodipicolinate reductase [Lactobacillus delbrueckii subsp. lactis]